jgi:hypothetical protein
MWEPRRLTTLWVSTACYRGSFTFFYSCIGTYFWDGNRWNTSFVFPCSLITDPVLWGFLRCRAVYYIIYRYVSPWNDRIQLCNIQTMVPRTVIRDNSFNIRDFSSAWLYQAWSVDNCLEQMFILSCWRNSVPEVIQPRYIHLLGWSLCIYLLPYVDSTCLSIYFSWYLPFILLFCFGEWVWRIL